MIELNTYTWREGVAFKADPIDVGTELEIIRENNNLMLPITEVVAFARDKDSALHECFEWDDSTAANAYRYMQARKVIGGLLTIVKVGEDETQMVEIPIRKYESAEDGIFMDTLEMLSDDSFREKVLSDIRTMIKRAVKKLRDYEAVLGEMSGSLQMRLLDLDTELKQELEKDEPPQEAVE